MWFKILQIVQFVLTAILEAEILAPVGNGAEKKERVVKSTAAELRRQGIVGAEGELAGDAVLEDVGVIVDGFVSLLNHAGSFRHMRAARPAGGIDPKTDPETDP